MQINKSVTGSAYIKAVEDGVMAGPNEEKAVLFKSAQAVYDHYVEQAAAGDHTAWNLCYEAESLVASGR